MKPAKRNKRLGIAAGAVVTLSGAAALLFAALEQNIAYFYTPSDLTNLDELPQKTIRIGGLVQDGSIQRGDGLITRFILSDGLAQYRITYSGILPDLFREGQGVIAQGRIQTEGEFTAHTVLAKHDENYVPRELANALAEKGYAAE